MKKKVDAKVNRLAQKAAEKAKTGPVSAPQASFLTSGLPDVVAESDSSSPFQGAVETDNSPEEEKAIDPTVDNIEVADMDIEDDSDNEKSETSEEASADDPKESNVQTPQSTESSDSQPVNSTSNELDNSSVTSPSSSAAPAQPLAPTVRPMVPVQGSLLSSQPPLVSPQPGMVIRPFIGVQRFPSHSAQFTPSVPQVQPTPGMAQNPLIQPRGTLAGHGQAFQQMAAGLIPNAGAQIPSGMGAIQPFQLGSGFVASQARLSVAPTTVQVPVQVTANAVSMNEVSRVVEGASEAVLHVGSPDSEASAPSPVGSPELHLGEGDETPETTPAPLGDVDVKEKTEFETNQSFFDNPVKSSTLNPGIGYKVSSAPTTFTGPPLSGSGMTSTEQAGGPQQDEASTKKDSGQKVSAVDILAQLLSRGRKLQETGSQGSDLSATPENRPSITPAVAPEKPKENSGNPTSKPLLTLIDTLFPKLSDSIKTLKEKEKSVNPSETQFHPSNLSDSETSSSCLPALPLSCESRDGASEPPFQQSQLKVKGPNEDQRMTKYNVNHADVDGRYGDPGRPLLPSDEMSKAVPKEMISEFKDDARSGDVSQEREYQSNQLEFNDVTSLPSPKGHPGNQFSGSPFRGASPRFPHEMPFKRVSDFPPHGGPVFEQRAPMPRPRGPSFNQYRGSTARPFGDGSAIQRGPPHLHSSRGPRFERVPRDSTDVNEQVLPYGPSNIHSSGVPSYERHHEGQTDQPGKAHDSPKGPPVMSNQTLPNQHGPPYLSSPRGFRGDLKPEIVPDRSAIKNSTGGSLKDVPLLGPSKISAGQALGDAVPPLDDSKKPLIIQQDSHVNEPPGIRRFPQESTLQRPLESRRVGPPPPRAPYPLVRDDEERRRQFDHWEDSQREGYREHARAPWDVSVDRPGPPPPHWRGPPGDPNRTDFLDDDPSMWTSFENTGKSPGRFVDFPNRTREGFREGPPGFDRYRDNGPPVRKRHSVGEFDDRWMHHPGPLKRPGPPPVPFSGPAKRPYY